MNLNSTCRVGAIFKLVAKKVGTDEIVRETPEFHNLVLDSGLARMNVGVWIDRCCIGTGTSEPNVTQTALDSFLVSTTSYASTESGIQVTELPRYYYSKVYWKFNPGQVTQPITEVGLGWNSTGLWNRTLIKDILGNPTSFTVNADEYLEVVSEVRVYPSEYTTTLNVEDGEGNILSTHDITVLFRYNSGPYGATWACYQLGFGRSDGSLAFSLSSNALDTTVSGLGSGQTSRENINNSLTRSGNSIKVNKQYSGSERNMNHRSLYLGLYGLLTSPSSTPEIGYKIGIEPPIEKTSADMLIYNFTLSWDRYTPE